MNNKEWVPVAKELPPNGTTVLMCEDSAFYVMTMHYDAEEKQYWEDSYGYYQEINNNQAWMLLPEPYKEGEE